MLDNFTSALESTFNQNFHYRIDTVGSGKTFSFPIAVTSILQRFRKNNERIGKSLVAHRSAPNLLDISEQYSENVGSSFKNKSTECLENFPFNTDQKTNVVRVLGDFRKTSEVSASAPTTLKKLEDVHMFLNPENTHIVTIRKGSQGLGLSICGGRDPLKTDMFSQLIRISKLYPLQPARASGSLFIGDIILEVNEMNMIGLTNTQALEHLRSSGLDVTFKVFRPMEFSFPSLSLCKEFWPLALTSPFSGRKLSLEKEELSRNETKEFQVTLVKQGGSLGFSIFKNEENNGNEFPAGIYVKSLIRDPALSDGRIHPGDRIVKVNGVDISSLAHADAIDFLRNASTTVVLTLCRENPLSPLSLEDDVPVSKCLRWEAVELLNDRNKFKDNSGSSLSKQRLRRNVYFCNEEPCLLSAVRMPSAPCSDEAQHNEISFCEYSCSMSAKSQEVQISPEINRHEFKHELAPSGCRETVQVQEFEVVLHRRWHGRFGFSIQDPPVYGEDASQSVLPKTVEVKAVHSGSLAEKDGRIQVQDRLLEVNSESILEKPAAEVIDLLRKKKGPTRMVFCRLKECGLRC